MDNIKKNLKKKQLSSVRTVRRHVHFQPRWWGARWKVCLTSHPPLTGSPSDTTAPPPPPPPTTPCLHESNVHSAFFSELDNLLFPLIMIIVVILIVSTEKKNPNHFHFSHDRSQSESRGPLGSVSLNQWLSIAVD